MNIANKKSRTPGCEKKTLKTEEAFGQSRVKRPETRHGVRSGGELIFRRHAHAKQTKEVRYLPSGDPRLVGQGVPQGGGGGGGGDQLLL